MTPVLSLQELSRPLPDLIRARYKGHLEAMASSVEYKLRLPHVHESDRVLWRGDLEALRYAIEVLEGLASEDYLAAKWERET